MKMSTIILLIICLVFSLVSKAQELEKETVISFKNVPLHVPLASQDFQTLSSVFGYRKHPILKKKGDYIRGST
ncbi:hypothetical protein A8C32_18120 [Flavivirga aquatica]|uniref:Uncharacterized protein n=1 Tax=Flavivirga aquatica TaxID=1849968 RepID=A0A1E5T7J9_9FLAO|nr:hypothetical protein [Flavivirga aquatica]OEK07353.1 hypothetical protein A8C32_18120 [Flavivirga aquatica]